MQNVVAVRGDPHAALHGHRKQATAVSSGANARGRFGALFKAKLPGGLAAPLPEPLAMVGKIRFILRIKEIHAEPNKSLGRQRSGEGGEIFAAVAFFFQVDVSFLSSLAG